MRDWHRRNGPWTAEQLFNPCSWLIRVREHRTGTMNGQRAQVGIVTFANHQ